MTLAIAIFVAAFLLMVLHGWLYRRPGYQRLLTTPVRVRADQATEPLLLACIGGAVLAITVIEIVSGVIKGVRLGVVQRAEHPIWFWLIIVIMGLASSGMLIFNLQDFARALRPSRDDATR